MSLVLVTAPTAEPVTLAEVKAQLRITVTTYDTLLNALITAVRMHLDGRDGWLGRALLEQTWDLKLDCFYSDEIRIPLGPLRSITSVIYKDASGNQQTLSTADYQVVGVDNGWQGSITPSYGKYWPNTYPQPESVTIRFIAGYAPGSGSPGDPAQNVPAPIKQAMLLMIKNLYALGERNLFVSAETVDGVGAQQFIVSDNASKVMNDASDLLLGPLRIWNFA
jgi:uncharacterized phiE125 gp8 family phage protein